MLISVWDDVYLLNQMQNFTILQGSRMLAIEIYFEERPAQLHLLSQSLIVFFMIKKLFNEQTFQNVVKFFRTFTDITAQHP